MNLNPQWMWWALGAVVVLLIIGLIAAGVRRARTSALREHFGKEYDRAMRETGTIPPIGMERWTESTPRARPAGFQSNMLTASNPAE